MAESPIGRITLMEDFTNDLTARWTETTTGGSQDILNRHGGWWGQTIRVSQEGDVAALAGELAWEVDEGFPLIMEVRWQADVVTPVSSEGTSVFIGMTDAVNDSVIIEDEGGTLNTVPTDAFGFLLESEQDETWQAVGVDTNVDKTQAAMTGTTDAANGVSQTLRMEAVPNGSGTIYYFVDGVLGSTRTDYFDSSLVYAPAVSTDGRNVAVVSAYDYIYVTAPRGAE